MNLRRSHVLSMLGAAPFVAASSVASAQNAKVRVGYTLTDTGFEPGWAQDQGFFTKAGLDVELFPFTNSLTQMAAVAGNALDVGFADAEQLATAIGHGVPIGAFAGAASYSTNSATVSICVARDGPIKSAKDLEGQTIGTIALTGGFSLATRAWLDQNGVDSTKVKFFEMPFPQMAPAVARGTLAAAVIGEPFVTFAGDSVRALGKPMDSFGKQFTAEFWFTSRDFAAHNADALRRLTAALYETARWANSHQSESLQVLVTAAKLDIERIRTMTRSPWATSFQPRDLSPQLDLAVKYKELAGPVAPADLVVSLR
jgi:NitT/TauT family transport system substrate-binding protein